MQADPAIPNEPRSTREDLLELLTDGIPLIDVRAPIEFVKGTFPSAVNLPLMTDEERHLVGIRYKEAGQEKAIQLGAELVDASARTECVNTWKAYAEAHPDGALYCFRGGLRSRIAQAWLAEAGVDWPLIKGGYKALRTFALSSLERLSDKLPFVLVGGRTGSGKTELLLRVSRHIDLEGLANHRGSSFGGMVSEQPTPINFENALAIDMLRLELAGGLAPVWLEDEARLIGRLCLPESLREAMLQAPVVILETPLEQRVVNCTQDYVIDLLARYQLRLGEEKGFDAYTAHHHHSLDRIRKRLGGQGHTAASALLTQALQAHRDHADTGAYSPFIELLLTDYYDPMYDYQMRTKDREVLLTGDAEVLLGFTTEHHEEHRRADTRS